MIPGNLTSDERIPVQCFSTMFQYNVAGTLPLALLLEELLPSHAMQRSILLQQQKIELYCCSSN